MCRHRLFLDEALRIVKPIEVRNTYLEWSARTIALSLDSQRNRTRPSGKAAARADENLLSRVRPGDGRGSQ